MISLLKVPLLIGQKVHIHGFGKHFFITLVHLFEEAQEVLAWSCEMTANGRAVFFSPQEGALKDKRHALLQTRIGSPGFQIGGTRSSCLRVGIPCSRWWIFAAKKSSPQDPSSRFWVSIQPRQSRLTGGRRKRT